MVDYTTIKITNNVKDKLLDLKVDNEGYSVIIANLLEENKKLKEDVEYLKEDKSKLYKLALATSDSVALVNNIHKVTFFIALVVNDVSSTEEEKLTDLKKYLKEMLATDKDSVIASIDNLKDMLASEEASVPEVLLAFESYVENYTSWSVNLYMKFNFKIG